MPTDSDKAIAKNLLDEYQRLIMVGIMGWNHVAGILGLTERMNYPQEAAKTKPATTKPPKPTRRCAELVAPPTPHSCRGSAAREVFIDVINCLKANPSLACDTYSLNRVVQKGVDRLKWHLLALAEQGFLRSGPCISSGSTEKHTRTVTGFWVNPAVDLYTLDIEAVVAEALKTSPGKQSETYSEKKVEVPVAPPPPAAEEAPKSAAVVPIPSADELYELIKANPGRTRVELVPGAKKEKMVAVLLLLTQGGRICMGPGYKYHVAGYVPADAEKPVAPEPATEEEEVKSIGPSPYLVPKKTA